jgi:putative flippase GtrA
MHKHFLDNRHSDAENTRSAFVASFIVQSYWSFSRSKRNKRLSLTVTLVFTSADLDMIHAHAMTDQSMFVFDPFRRFGLF